MKPGVVLKRLLGLSRFVFLFPWTVTQPLRKTVRYRTRRAIRHTSKAFWVRLKGYAARQLKSPELFEESSPSAAVPASQAAHAARIGLPFDEFVEAQEVREVVTLLGRGPDPIIVGPWLTETGFELLYWIPFLAWAKAYGNLDEHRLIVVSRGGVASWYRHIATHYQDILTDYTIDQFRLRNEERTLSQPGSFKHRDVSDFDREIVERVSHQRKLGKVRLLHPSLMYRLFSLFWHQRVSTTFVEAFSRYRRFEPDRATALARRLPQEYVAAKFYVNAALPDCPENRRLVSTVLTELTRTSDVVLLKTGHQFDEHLDYPSAVASRLHTVEDLMAPETNLDVQTQIIGGARAFVGTYGGFSYLAPLCGINTLALYSNPAGFRFDHLELANRVFARLRGGSFVALDSRNLDMVRLGAGGLGAESGARAG